MLRLGIQRFFIKAVNRRGAPLRRGPARILDFDEARVTVKFQSRTFGVARCCVRKWMEEGDVSEVEWNPASGAFDSRNGAQMEALEMAQECAGLPWEESGEPDATMAGLQRSNSEIQSSGSSSPSPGAIPVSESPNLSVQLPSSPSFSVQLPPPVSSFDKNCTSSLASAAECGGYGHLPYDQIR